MAEEGCTLNSVSFALAIVAGDGGFSMVTWPNLKRSSHYKREQSRIFHCIFMLHYFLLG